MKSEYKINLESKDFSTQIRTGQKYNRRFVKLDFKVTSDIILLKSCLLIETKIKILYPVLKLKIVPLQFYANLVLFLDGWNYRKWVKKKRGCIITDTSPHTMKHYILF